MKFFDSYYFVFKLSLWGAILYCVFFLILGFTVNSPIYISVSPIAEEEFSTTLASFPQAIVYATGKLEILKPTLQQKIIFRDIYSYKDIVNNSFWLVLSVTLLMLVNALEANAGFKQDLSKFLRVAGIALITYFFIGMVRDAIASENVSSLTNNKFHYSLLSKYPIHLELWIGILLIWFARSYKKAMQLQKEQDLTI